MKHRLLHEIIPVTTSHGCGTKRVLLAKEDTQTNLTQIAVTGLKQGERSEMHVHPTMEEVFLIRKVTIQNWRIDYHVSFPYLRAKLKT